MRYAVLRSVGDGSAFPRGNVRRRLRRAAHLSLVGATLLLGGAAAPAQPSQARTVAGLPEAGSAADAGAPARPVAAWNDFCARYPSECTVDPSEPTLVTLTPALWHTLTTVNRRVNARIKPITDMAHWGVVDRWDFPDDGFGDCEDIQLLKRRMLVERRLPRRALRMTVVIDEIGEGHAVLMVRTDRGDLILDNKTNAVLPWQRTGYSFIKREGQDGRAWVGLDNGTSPVTTANR
ncbi:transglutaminase-like cysteine peptidase [Methylorubrum extorquens]|uniref:transglutaminase-like cysteine peptidase n=1 Tax=Methylorubrum extorquens TaxID=408 RepID=UPI000158EF48|nr:transglutaminase-like cysteine peptidase [Methylorubrum extorquens]ABY30651.1 transglutaminase family protein cysteine peptidase BTLCP [Methylorubrum extorquens PA1]KQP87404.1 transglutaminase [Methylobacterium sp. Leaf119]WIU41922.1 transglutaminase-like cysteine peptidase [Methylorubrum extorquens]